MVATQVAMETIGLWKLMKSLNFLLSFLTMIHYDNQSCIAMFNNPHFHSHNKHIALEHHFVKEKTKSGKVFLMFCLTNQVIVDVLTKPLPQEKHNDCFFSF